MTARAVCLPAHAPELNPQEGMWPLVKRDVGNLAATDLGQITQAVKRRLKRLQYRPLVDGCLAATGLMPEAAEASQSRQFA
nr:hypothetical protein [Streptomyces sp. H51]